MMRNHGMKSKKPGTCFHMPFHLTELQTMSRGRTYSVSWSRVRLWNWTVSCSSKQNLEASAPEERVCECVKPERGQKEKQQRTSGAMNGFDHSFLRMKCVKCVTRWEEVRILVKWRDLVSRNLRWPFGNSDLWFPPGARRSRYRPWFVPSSSVSEADRPTCWKHGGIKLLVVSADFNNKNTFHLKCTFHDPKVLQVKSILIIQKSIEIHRSLSYQQSVAILNKKGCKPTLRVQALCSPQLHGEVVP